MNIYLFYSIFVLKPLMLFEMYAGSILQYSLDLMPQSHYSSRCCGDVKMSNIARHRANVRQCSPMIGCISFASPPVASA